MSGGRNYKTKWSQAMTGNDDADSGSGMSLAP
eukprot:CAMPEP_0198330874 /NCGR_PEP_ID=MMETSP1450-20131203/17217_1 /TAXON_ID=753684 ORGANISM="Madagascaria erythrocladiodes, Strain CCMP3234" /NCGR_SAMPLE_ID=MMETSP1450 /ASSEMBLY_ACC=CAM_ASM_001115 /LENGTH=31 /DNA_ID= /DNA_START= /DNA_END= /DNA_ORIENTATION=